VFEIIGISESSKNRTLSLSAVNLEALRQLTDNDVNPPPDSPKDYKKVEYALGRGRMSINYRGRIVHDGTTVAVKVYPLGFPTLRAKTSLLFEATLGAGLKHDNILPVLGVVLDDNNPALAVRLIEGYSSLNKSLTLTQKLQVLEALLSALAYVHHLGLAHRDLCPTNIALDSNNTPFIMGWSLGMDRQRFGKFTAPEVARGSCYGAMWQAADVYSFGVIASEMLTETDMQVSGKLSGWLQQCQVEDWRQRPSMSDLFALLMQISSTSYTPEDIVRIRLEGAETKAKLEAEIQRLTSKVAALESQLRAKDGTPLWDSKQFLNDFNMLWQSMETEAKDWMQQACIFNERYADVQYQDHGAEQQLGTIPQDRLETISTRLVELVRLHTKGDEQVLITIMGVCRRFSWGAKSRPLFVRLNLIPVILAVLEFRLSSANVVEQACLLLGSLAVSSKSFLFGSCESLKSKSGTGTAQATLGKSGAPSMFASIFVAHIASEKVMSPVTFTCWMATLNVENKLLFARTEIVQGLAHAIDKHSNSVKVVRNACGALWMLATQGKDMRYHFMHLNGGSNSESPAKTCSERCPLSIDCCLEKSSTQCICPQASMWFSRLSRSRRYTLSRL